MLNILTPLNKACCRVILHLAGYLNVLSLDLLPHRGIKHGFLLKTKDRLLDTLKECHTPVNGTGNGGLILGERRIVAILNKNRPNILEFGVVLGKNAVSFFRKKGRYIQTRPAPMRTVLNCLEGQQKLEGRLRTAQVFVKYFVDEVGNLLVEVGDHIDEG
ncbi:unnamed protein product [Phytomonas sp. EM1]|nr:unnamed protein product [Phytomonas sp. EM1]|eukprot:CCW59847.1 unnamed protein product [Phytomonas sp. isolate EM1]